MSMSEEARAAIEQLEAALTARGVHVNALVGSDLPKDASKVLKQATRAYGDAFWQFEMGQRAYAQQTAQKALDSLEPLPVR